MGETWKNKFSRVISVIHTKYLLAYVRREKNGQVTACCLGYGYPNLLPQGNIMNTWVTRMRPASIHPPHETYKGQYGPLTYRTQFADIYECTLA